MCILEKEIRYALRDTDVLIYSVLVPLIVYPIFILGAGEVLLWQTSSADQSFVVVTQQNELNSLPPYFADALQKTKEFKLAFANDPKAELKRKKGDAALLMKHEPDHNSFVCYTTTKRGMVVSSKLQLVLEEAQSKSRALAYKEHGVPPDLLDIYSLSDRHLVPIAPHEAKVETRSPIQAVLAVMIGLLQAGLVAGVTSVCMFAEEKEKKTYETTVSLPVPDFAITTGKWLAATLITLVSSVLYIITVGASFFVVALQLMTAQKENPHSLYKLMYMDLQSWFLASLAILLGAGIGCALCMLCVSACRRFKDAQALSMYPMFIILSLPMLVMIPGIEQSPFVAFIPLTNILIALKHPQGGWVPIAIGTGESLVLIAVCLWFAGKIFFSEKSLTSSAGAGGATLNQRQQAESV